ncbi:hypothetical protein OAN22_02120 [Alphaproteobacteria bacterium]|nr:hypothetical protein [Alphaproteobacteria bacterium]
MRVHAKVINLVDKDRQLTRTSRTSWIAQAVVERLRRLGYELDDEDVEDTQEKLPL